MSTRNRFSPLAPDDPFPQLPPSPEGHQIIEFEWRPAAPVEARVPLQVNSAVPSFTQDEEQGSFHELEDISAYIREQGQQESPEPVGIDADGGLPDEASHTGSTHLQALRTIPAILTFIPTTLITSHMDNADMSRRTTGEPMTESASPPVERAESIPKIWKTGHPYVFRPPVKPVDGDVWEKIRAEMEKHDNEMCKAWNGELDTILVFAGLFSAAVTAFCVESFQSLPQNPSDTTNAFLLALSLQLANSSSPVADATIANAFNPAKHDVQINVLYFISLAFALSVSSVCILGKQWIREYEKDVIGTPCDAVRVRQMRYDSLQAWKVPQIIASLPVVLIVALLLFFTGLLVQLWHVSEHTTAAAVSAIVAVTALLVIVTTLAPAYCGSWYNQTSFVPFRSPQAWVFFVAYRQAQRWWDLLFDTFIGEVPPVLSNWNAFDLHFLEIERSGWFDHDISSIHRVLRWVYHTLSTSETMKQCVFWCLQSPEAIPERLVKYDHPLVSYVFPQEESTGPSYWPDHTWHDISCGELGWQNTESSAGRYQIETLLRTCNQAIEHISSDWGKAMDKISDCCRYLNLYHHVFRSVSGENVRYQHDIHDQISLMLQRAFAALENFPSHSQSPPDFYYIVLLLCKASRDSTAPLSRRLARDVVLQGIPPVLRKTKSITLALAIAQAALECSGWSHFSLRERPFISIDKCIYELWSVQEGVEGRTEKALELWKELRSNAMTWRNVKIGRRFNLADLNGPLPIWNPSIARAIPSRFDRISSIFGIDWGATGDENAEPRQQ